MAEVKGKYITMIATLMSMYEKEKKEADASLFDQLGKHYDELTPEGWYDIKWIILFLNAYVRASPSKEYALVTFGRQVYPALKKANLLPTHLKTPLDYIKFEAEGFSRDHKGPEVKPRKFIKAVDKDVIVEAPSPGYNSKMFEGVYLGILEMLGIKTGKVVQTKSQEKGDNTSEFHITW